ncbi:MAG: hypothetical protein Q7U54_19120 [Bacteroidales bacterium]|nr:hypothetical protein [Bacteroidales bacterium]
MKAIEINARTDKSGYLKIDYPVNKPESNVRVIILVEEKTDEVNEETLWMKTIASNPAFDFLNEPGENIYSLTDGKPFND